MHDEFRIRVELAHDDATRLIKALEEVEHDTPSAKHVAVSHEGGHVFLYADSGESAVWTLAAVEKILAEQHIDGQVSSWRWHPEEDRWEDESVGLPSTPVEHAAEHERLEQEETQESEQAG
jgi:hypothetical protein